MDACVNMFNFILNLNVKYKYKYYDTSTVKKGLLLLLLIGMRDVRFYIIGKQKSSSMNRRKTQTIIYHILRIMLHECSVVV